MYNPKFSPIAAHDVLLHGWAAGTESWHGPIPLTPGSGAARQTSRVRTARGGFQGKLRCSVAGLPCVEFHTAVYDLLDTGLAIVHLDGGQVRPAGIMAVVPRNRHQLLRNDFAFELMTVVSFLGAPINSGCELEINDYMEQALRMEPLATQIFAIETAELSTDVGIVLSAHFENLAAAMLDWLARRDLQADGVLEAEEYEECVTLPGRCAALTARRVAG